MTETCEQYHTRRCEGLGPHTSDRNKPQGIRWLSPEEGYDGVISVCYECHKRLIAKLIESTAWQKLEICTETTRGVGQ